MDSTAPNLPYPNTFVYFTPMTSQVAQPNVLTKQEAADFLRVSHRTMDALIAKRAFPKAHKVGVGRGHWRIPVADLEAYQSRDCSST